MHNRPVDSPSRLPRTVRVLGLASLLNDIASEMIFPLLPKFLLVTLGASRTELGLIEGLADTTASVLKLVSGHWSDRLARRKQFVVAGYSLAALSRPVLGVCSGAGQILALRLVDRFGKGIRTAPRDALLADSVPAGERGRAFGFHRAMDHLGAAIGPLLALGYLSWAAPEGSSNAQLEWALRSLFGGALLPGLAVVALVAWGLREPPHPAHDASRVLSAETSPGSQAAPASPALFTPPFRRFLLSLGLFTLGNSSDAFLLVRAGEVGVPVAQLPLLWCVFHIAKTQGNLWAGRLVDRVGPRPLITLGWLLYLLVYLGFGWAQAPWQVWGLFLLYAGFYALTEPAEKTLVTQLTPAEVRGSAFGWFHGVIGLAALPASLLFGLLYDRLGPTAAFGMGAGLALVALVVFRTIPPPVELRTPPAV
jgi:MFS family permease